MTKRHALALIGIVMLGGGLRLGVMARTFPVRLIGDEIYYSKVALGFAESRGRAGRTTPFPANEAWRPPAHSYFLSLFVPRVSAQARPPGPRHLLPTYLRPLVLSQVAIGTSLVAATVALGAALFGARVGLLAGLVTAVEPTLVAHSHYLWSEGLFALLVTAAIAGVVLVERARSAWLAALTGIAFGAAALTREIAVPVAFAASLWWLRPTAGGRARPALGHAALLLASMALVILPWTLRNSRALGRFVPIGTVGWFAAAQGNTLESPNWLLPDGPAKDEFDRKYFLIPGEAERIDFARRHTLERIRAEQPTWIFKKIVRNLSILLGPDSYLLYKIRRGAYGESSDFAARWIAAVSIASYAIVSALGVLGIAGATGRGHRSLTCLVFAAVAAVHVAANAASRFRMPWMPLVIVYASHCVLDRRSVADALRGRRWVVPAIVLAFLFGVCFPYYFVYGGQR